jgi:Family of unknown function (DUF6174)
MLGAWPISNYFQFIDRQISANAPYIEIEYDPTYGFPTTVYMIVEANLMPAWHELFDFQTHGLQRRLGA